MATKKKLTSSQIKSVRGGAAKKKAVKK